MFKRKTSILLFIVALITFLPVLAVLEIHSGDETRVAGIAADMFNHNQYLIPKLNGSNFLEYPPLCYWAIMLGYKIFGIVDFAAKLPSVFGAAGIMVLIYLLAKKLNFTHNGAVISSLMYLFNGQILSEGVVARVDMLLSFFIMLSVYEFYLLYSATNGIKLSKFLLFVLGLSGGFYTKGLLGLGLPLMVCGTYLVARDIIDKRISYKYYVTLLLAFIVSALIGGIWYYAVYCVEGYESFHIAFIYNNFQRFTSSKADHASSIYGYIFSLPALFLPWIILLPFAIVSAIRNLKSPKDTLLPLVFAIVPFLILSLASAKRQIYLLPLYAPAALLSGNYLVQLFEKYFPKFSLSPKQIFFSLSSLITIVIIIELSVAFHGNSKESLRKLFDKCAQLEAQGKTIKLLNAPERTRGAACFYLRHRVEESSNMTNSPDIYYIIRKKNYQYPAESYNDHHKITQSNNKSKKCDN